MFFDGNHYAERRDLPPPPRPKPPVPGERVILSLVFWFLIVLMVLPISAGSFVDIVRYVRGH